MAYIAYLQFGDNKQYNATYTVTDFRYHNSRHHNGIRPDADPICECIELILKVPTGKDLELYRWFVNGDSKNGRILIVLSSEDNNEKDIYKEVIFTDALCFAISENFIYTLSKPRELKLSFMATKVEIYNTDQGIKKGLGLSNATIKGIMAPKDLIPEDASITPEANFTLQQFRYELSRERNDEGIPFGPTQKAFIDFDIKIPSANSGQSFYDYMYKNEPFPFSFLFDTSFQNKLKLYEFMNAIVAQGYVIDVEETFDKDANTYGHYSLMLMKIRLLLSKVTFVGVTKDKNLELTVALD